MSPLRPAALVAAMALAGACSSEPTPGDPDATPPDARPADAGVDAAVDAIPPDASPWPAAPKSGDFAGAVVADGWASNVAVAGASDGGVVIAVHHGGVIHIGGGTISNDSNNTLLSVARLDPRGALLWSRAIAPAQYGSTPKLAVAADGAIVVGGVFEGALVVDPAVASAGGEDGFVVRLGADGALAWVRTLASPHGDLVADVAIGPGGEVTAIGGSWSQLDLGGGPLAPGTLLARFSAEGVHRWSRSWDGRWSYGEYGFLAATADGGVIATSAVDRLELDGITVRSVDGDDPIVIGFTAEGRARFGVAIHDERYGYIEDVAVASTGVIYLAGRTGDGQVVVGDQTLWGDHDGDPYLVALTPDGAVDWARLVRVASASRPYALATDDTSVYLAASCSGTVRLAEPVACDRGSFIAAWNDLGEHRWSAFVGAEATGLVLAPGDRLYSVGISPQLESTRFDDIVIPGHGLYLAELIP
jgi:hypothetical protein